MTIRERIENHLGLVIGAFVVTSFAAGFGAYATIQSISARPDQESGTMVDWEDTARQQGWVPKGECPAVPVSLTISSPGDQAIVNISPGTDATSTDADLVVRSSYPIIETMDLGVVYNEEGTSNFYVDFPLVEAAEDRKVFRTAYRLSIPFVLRRSGSLNIWAFVVDDESSIGNVFSSLSQIQDSNETVVLSPKTTLQLKGQEGGS
jgi:hypothetical protein